MASLDNIFAIDCDTVLCPAGALGAMDVQTENCNDVNQSEVDSLIMWHPTLGVAPTNWGAGIAAIDFDIDNTDATDVKQKQLFVKGGMPASEEITKTLNSFQDVVIKLPLIEYEYNKADLRPNSKDSLDYLYNIMTENTIILSRTLTVIILRSSHSCISGHNGNWFSLLSLKYRNIRCNIQ